MKMIYPCTFTKKVDDDGDTFWRGEQKQLDIVVEDAMYPLCIYRLEQAVKETFKVMTGSDALDYLIHCEPVSAKGIISFKVPENRTLSEFMPAGASDEDAEGVEDEIDLPDVNEVNMAALEAVNAEEVTEDWIPKLGDAVVYKTPEYIEECGVFIITEDDPELEIFATCNEVEIAPIDTPDSNFQRPNLYELAPCRVGSDNLQLCREFREYQKQRYLNAIPGTEDDGGIADGL